MVQHQIAFRTLDAYDKHEYDYWGLEDKMRIQGTIHTTIKYFKKKFIGQPSEKLIHL